MEAGRQGPTLVEAKKLQTDFKAVVYFGSWLRSGKNNRPSGIRGDSDVKITMKEAKLNRNFARSPRWNWRIRREESHDRIRQRRTLPRLGAWTSLLHAHWRKRRGSHPKNTASGAGRGLQNRTSLEEIGERSRPKRSARERRHRTSKENFKGQMVSSKVKGEIFSSERESKQETGRHQS